MKDKSKQRDLTAKISSRPTNTEAAPITESLKVTEILGTTITSIANIDSNGDGKVQTLEVLNTLQIVAFKAISNRPDLAKLKEEALDYSEIEKTELALSISLNTGMTNKKAEVLVERALTLLIEIFDFIVDALKPAAEFENL